MRPDRIGIGGEIEHPSHPRDDLRQGRLSGKRTRTSIRFFAAGATLITPWFAPIAIVRR